jgi:hypothetical protein
MLKIIYYFQNFINKLKIKKIIILILNSILFIFLLLHSIIINPISILLNSIQIYIPHINVKLNYHLIIMNHLFDDLLLLASLILSKVDSYPYVILYFILNCSYVNYLLHSKIIQKIFD